MCEISVVVPVYNTEKTLPDCVASLLKQSFEDFEILLVDDGSTDGSAALCDAFAERHARVRVFRKANGGAASARNLGLARAKGRYISFADADDTAAPSFLAELYAAAVGHGADLAMCDYIKHTESGAFPFNQPIRGGFYDRAQIENELFPCLVMFDSLEFPPTISNCVCLFRKELLDENSISYPEVRLCEDSVFGSHALYNSKGFVYLKGRHLYDYSYGPESVSRSCDIRRLRTRWDSFLKLNAEYERLFSRSDGFDFTMQIKYNMLCFALNQLSYIRRQRFSFPRRLRETKAVLREKRLRNAFENFSYPKVGFRLKVLIFLVRHRLAAAYCLLRR